MWLKTLIMTLHYCWKQKIVPALWGHLKEWRQEGEHSSFLKPPVSRSHTWKSAQFFIMPNIVALTHCSQEYLETKDYLYDHRRHSCEIMCIIREYRCLSISANKNGTQVSLMLFLWIIGMGKWPQICQSMTVPNVCLAEFKEFSNFIDYWENGEKGRMNEEREGNQVVSTSGRCAQLQGPCSSYSITLNLLGFIIWVP